MDQLALKRGRLVGALARYPALELVYTDPVVAADPVRGYRTRAKLMVGKGGLVGLYAKGGGHEVVDLPRCQVLSPVLLRVANAIRARMQAGLFTAPLRAIDVRELRPTEAEAEALLTLVVLRGTDLDRVRVDAEGLMAELPEIVGIAANLHDGESPQVLGSETVHLVGRSSAPDRVGNSVHTATFGSFVQVHRAQAGRIHTMLVSGLGMERRNERLRILDLYSGSGSIALALAARGADVVCVESFGPAATRIEQSAAEAKLSVSAIHSDAASAVRRFAETNERFDAIIVNPPRRGVGAATREWLGRLDVPLLAYVSCEPDTLARDLDHFRRLGYGCPSTQPLDMIPLSDEVETVAILHRGPVPTPTVLYQDESIFIVDKAPHEPTTPLAEYKSSLLTRVRRLPGGADAVPIHDLDVGTSGVCMFARTPNHMAAWHAALTSESTRKIYLSGARGIVPTKGTVARELREGNATLAARTKYRRIAIFTGHSVVRVMPEQGRTHQIRKHLAQLGHPLLGDDKYGHAPTNRHFEEKYGLDRTFLHCVRLEIEHPKAGRLVVESPLPGDLHMVLERGGGPGTVRFLEQKNALGRAGTSSYPPSIPAARDSGSLPVTDRPRPELQSDDD